MCGRYAYYGPSSLLRLLGIDEPGLDILPRYNIAPLQDAPVVRQRPSGERVVQLLRWGLLPPWAKDTALAGKLINARAETLAEKPSFRSAYKSRRCLVPANGFYEWKVLPTGKQPYFIRSATEELLAFAGLWERWTPPEGEPLDTFTIVTTTARDELGELHERMPVILDAEDYGLWLARDTEPDLVRQLLEPRRLPRLEVYPVSAAVGNVRNEGPDLIQPAEAHKD